MSCYIWLVRKSYSWDSSEIEFLLLAGFICNGQPRNSLNGIPIREKLNGKALMSFFGVPYSVKAFLTTS